MSGWITEAQASEIERSAGRGELARVATEAARAAAPGVDVEVLWDDMWVRRVGTFYRPDPEMFRVAAPDWKRWTEAEARSLRNADDYWFHLYKPAAGDVFVDVGAGRGEDVYVFSRVVGPSGRVVAIEPHPGSYAILRKFCELNRLSNVTTIHRACVDQPAELQIETMPVWESNYVRSGEASATSFPVKGVRLDDLLDEYGIDRVDYLKMNIEGAERDALPGCPRTLARTRFACIAAHDFRAARGEGEHFRTLEFVRQYLTEYGFRLVTRDEDPRYYVPYHVHGVRA